MLAGLALAWLALTGAAASTQSTLPKRTFSAGAPLTYRVRLSVRVELEGKRPLPIGSKVYVEPVSHWAEVRLNWRATRRVQRLEGEWVEIEEALEDFSAMEGESTPENVAARELRQSLESSLAAWSKNRVLRYRESVAGQLTALSPPEGVPALGENAPQVLTLWLLRALRPTAPLPQRGVEIGQRWQEPREVKLAGWSETQGTESGEWLDAPGAAVPALRLYTTQQIVGRIPPGLAPAASSGTAAAAGQNSATSKEAGGDNAGIAGHSAGARFFADSLLTFALDDWRLLEASRGASREVIYELKDVPGLAEPQVFRSRLAVQVHIREDR